MREVAPAVLVGTAVWDGDWKMIMNVCPESCDTKLGSRQERRHIDRLGTKAHRKGFSMGELLAVVGIIGILLALLLPAVQEAREAARRVKCANNVRQMALAFQSHSSAQGIFPDGGEAYWAARTIENGSPAVAPKQNWGWPYQILPFIEMEAIWALPRDADVYSKSVPTYNCPSLRSPMEIRTSFRNNEIRVMMDYAGNAGTDPYFISGTDLGGFGAAGCNGWGMMGNGRDAPIVRRPDGTSARSRGPITVAHIKDGLSNTLLLGEKCLNVGKLGQSQTDDDSGWVDGWDWDHMRWGYLQPQPNFSDPGEPWFDPPRCIWIPHHSSFGTPHRNAMNMAMCDGSVRGLGINTSLDVFKRLSSRNDGQPLSSIDF